MLKNIFLAFLLLSVPQKIFTEDLIGEYYWGSSTKQSNDYEERLKEMNTFTQPGPTLIYKINNIYVDLNEIDCFDPTCPKESPVIRTVATIDEGKLRFQNIFSKENAWECDDSDYFIKRCHSNITKMNFDLYLNPVEEKDIKHLKSYKDEFSIVKELRKYDISAEYDDIPVKKVLNKTILYDPKTLKESFVLKKGNLIVVRANKKIKSQYFMAGNGDGVIGLIKISDFQKQLK